MSFLPESVAAELERLLLSVRPSEPGKVASIVSKHLTQVVSIAFPKPNSTTAQGGGSNSPHSSSLHADPNSSNGIMMEDMSVGAGSGLSLAPGAESRARAAADLLCAVCTCEGCENGARDVSRAVLKLMHRDNVARLRVSAAAVARFSRVLLEAFTEDFEAVTSAIDDSLMDNESVSLWLSLVARHSAMGDLVLQLWGGALCPTSAATAAPGVFAGPWIRHQAHSRIIEMLPEAIKNEEMLPLFSFLSEVLGKGLNAQIGHFVDHILIGHCGEGFIDAVLSAAEDSAATGVQLTDSFCGTQYTPALPEALQLLTAMLTMLQRSSNSQTSFRGDYHRSLKTNTAVCCFIKALPRLLSLLNSDALATRPGCFGSARLRIVDAMMTLFRFNRADSDDALFEHKFLHRLFQLCEEFPNHDVVLAALAEICTESIVRTCDGGKLERYLVEECRLQERLVAWVRDEEKWAGTSLRALALTVAFGFAQRSNDEEDDTSEKNNTDEANKSDDLSCSDKDDEKATPGKGGGGGDDDDDDEDIAALRKRSAGSKTTPSPSTSPKAELSPGSAGAPMGSGSNSEEWKDFVSTDLPGIWKEWFTEINGFRFQDVKSGGGRPVVHRPLQNLTKNGRGGRHAMAHGGAGRGGSGSSSSDSTSHGGGGDDERDEEETESMEETDRRIEKLFADARRKANQGKNRDPHLDPSSPPLELDEEGHNPSTAAAGSDPLSVFDDEEDDDGGRRAPTTSSGGGGGAAGGEPFGDEDEEFSLGDGDHRNTHGNGHNNDEEEEEEEFKLADIGAIDGADGDAEGNGNDQDADEEWVEKLVQEVGNSGGGSSPSCSAGAAAAEKDEEEQHHHADADDVEMDAAPPVADEHVIVGENEHDNDNAPDHDDDANISPAAKQKDSPVDDEDF